ncbi:MAG: rRNA maturation RNase YbeY [Rhizomicrobium sp.]
MSFAIDIQVDEPRWRKVRGLSARLRRATELALKRGKAGKSSALTILLTDDARLKELNRNFRGKNKPTNVLSFPSDAADGVYLGDIALAYDVTAAEARAGGKRFVDHAMHLTVHGVLHLLGFDHETDRAAGVMEPLETRILGELGIADPYARQVA